MMTDGKKYEKPEELDEFVTPTEAEEKARKYAQKLVDEALVHLEEGNNGEAARLLLELVLMIVTPISG
jgi:geranylgeranyl pyrophosphate synthase